ncbi:hypothetical protein TcCL_NonESM11575 [Trypanosoma cruzi]|nr:hypothetical protein TcCL_NonESM11575 [Trypanosoma cruzi]
MRPQCAAPRRRGSRTVSSSHSPPQPGSVAPRQLHSIARPTRIIEGCFCPPGRQSSTAAEDHWIPRTTQHERLTRLRYIEGVRGAICLEAMPSSIHWKAATTISLPGDAVLNGLRRVRRHMEISPRHIHAPHAEHRIVVWGTVSRSGLGVFQPRHAKDALDGVRRLAVEAACASIGSCVWIRRAAALLPGQPSSLWGLTAQPLAAASSPSPTRAPAATDTLSAMEALCLGPLAAHDEFTEAICTVLLSLADRGRAVFSTFSPGTAESHAA